MTRTERLLWILVFLTITFISYLFITNYDKLLIDINNLIDKLSGYEVVVPDYKLNERLYEYQTIELTNNFEPKNIDDIKNIYYTVLNSGWDEFTFYCKEEYKNCISDIKKVANDSNYISLINNYVNPYNSYKKYNTLITGDKEIYLKIERLYTKNEQNIIDEKIDSIFKNLNITKDNISKDKIKKLHDYLIKNITYDENYKQEDQFTDSSKATGALLSGIAICSGYADSFALMMDKLDIPNFKVSSDQHIWNVIYFDNKWYHIDVTWDDDEINENNYYNFFFVETKDLLKKDKKEHSFNLSDYLELLNQK